MGLREQIKAAEGLRLDLYRDAKGYWTIGYGHCVERKPISQRAADVILDDDVNDATRDVLGALPWTSTLAPARQDVLAEIAYWAGIGGLLGFHKMLAALEAGDYAEAAYQIVESDLTEVDRPRATRLSQTMREGVERA